MVKRIVTASIVAVVLVAAFVVVLGGRERPAPHEADDRKAAVQPFISRSATQPETVIESGELRLTPGDQTFAVIYDPVSGEPKYRFRAERWEPISDVEFKLTRPDIRIHAPDGQTTYIRSNEGQVILAQTGRRSVDPKRGWLRGDVRITIDRTTRQWRAAHPDQAELEQHQDQTINIFLTEVAFDLDRSRIESNGPLTVQSVEADVRGQGIEITWNQLDNRIDLLRIREGRKMELRRGGSAVDFAMPGTARAAAPEPPARARRGEAVARGGTTTQPVGGPTALARSEQNAAEAAAVLRAMIAATQPAPPASRIGPPGDTDLAEVTARMASEARGAVDKPEPTEDATASAPTQRPRRRVETYSAVFTGGVVVEQRQGLRRPGRLNCDKLELIFDFGQRQKRASLATETQPGATTRPADEAPLLGASPDDDTRLILTWSGPLEMRPMKVPPAAQSGDRFDCIASGERVEVDDGRGTAVCKQLVYRNELQQVWMSGTETLPVTLVSGDEAPVAAEGPTSTPGKGRLVGREMFFDRRRGLARIEGPGEMLREDAAADADPYGPSAAKRARDPARLRWTRGVELELKQAPEKRTDPATGRTQTVYRDFIQRAWFHGNVRVTRGDELIAGEHVAARFFPPRKPGASLGPIERLDASGRVRLERRPDLITAERLDVMFALSNDGKDSYPSAADAQGRVRARQGDRSIRGDRVSVKMTQLAAPPAASPTTRPAEPQLAMTELHAFGRVRAADPEQGFRVQAEELHTLVPDGRRLKSATVIGPPPGLYAFVQYVDYQLAGHRIELDMDRQAADIPGPGRAYFFSDRDFGGGELKKAEETRVVWTRSMQVRGRENTAVFEGEVRSKTPTHSMWCDRLTVLLADVPAPPPQARASPQPGSLAQGRFAQRLPSPRLAAYSLMAMAAAEASWPTWKQLTAAYAPAPAANVAPKAPRQNILLTDDPSRRKQPVRVIAAGNAVALRTVRHARSGRLMSRAQIKGSEIVVDLRRQSMNVPGRGSLLIEDYDLPKRGRGASMTSGSARPSLLGSGERPSQTAFQWANGMSYFVDQALVTFDREVDMRHFSGQNVVLMENLAAAQNVDPSQLRLPPGRKARLTCDNLLVQFARNAAQQAETMDVRGADLRQLVASGAVFLQDSGKSLQGERLTYSRDSNRVTIEGANEFEARIFDEDEQAQRFNMWRGPVLIWDRSTNRIEAPGARFTSGGRN